MPSEQKGLNKQKILKYSALGLVCFAGVAVLAGAMGRTAKANAKPIEEKSFKVKTTAVEPTGSGVFLEYTGLVQPAELMQVTFSTLGTIQEIYVKEGDPVTKGQLLARLDAEDAKRQQNNMQELASQTDAAVVNAQAARDQAKKDYDEACKTASREDLDKAQAKRDTAQANRDAKQKELDGFNQQVEKDKAALQAAQAEYDTAYAPLEQAAQAELTQAKQEETAAKQTLDAEQAAYDAKIAEIEADTEKSEEEKEAAKQAVSKEELNQAKENHAAAQKTVAEKQNKKDAVAFDPSLADEQSRLTNAQSQLARSQGIAGTAQTQPSALDTELNARQAAYDTLANQGPNSSEAKARKRALDSAENTLSIAKSAQITAKNSYQSAQSDVIDCDLKAPADGYVVKVVGNAGSMGTPIAPTVVLGSKRAMVQFGVSQNDVRNIKEGGSAQVTIGERSFDGTITSIATTPDTTTRTYMVNVDIVANTEDFYIGEMAQVKLEAGERTGAWLPLTCVLNDGEDYVYIVENGRAVRRAVTITDVSDDKLLLNGLDTGSLVITEGMKTVRSGSAVITE